MPGAIYIYDKIWKSDWFLGLSMELRMLFIYLNTTYLREYCGLYYCPLERIAADLGFSEPDTRAYIEALAPKVEYDFGTEEVFVVNHLHYQTGKKVSASQLVGVKTRLKKIQSTALLDSFYSRYPEIRDGLPSFAAPAIPTAPTSEPRPSVVPAATFDLAHYVKTLHEDSRPEIQILGLFLQHQNKSFSTEPQLRSYLDAHRIVAKKLVHFPIYQIEAVMEMLASRTDTFDYDWTLHTVLRHIMDRDHQPPAQTSAPAPKGKGKAIFDQGRHERNMAKWKETTGGGGTERQAYEDRVRAQTARANQDTPAYHNYVQDCLAGKYGPAAQERYRAIKAKREGLDPVPVGKAAQEAIAELKKAFDTGVTPEHVPEPEFGPDPGDDYPWDENPPDLDIDA